MTEAINHEPKKRGRQPIKPNKVIEVDFEGREHLLANLKQRATGSLRDPDQEILFILISALETPTPKMPPFDAP